MAQSTAGSPSDAKVIDLGDATVLPGLIGCYTHLVYNPGNYYEGILRNSATDQAFVTAWITSSTSRASSSSRKTSSTRRGR